MRRNAAPKTDIFTRFTSKIAIALGHSWVFLGAVLVLLIWGATGPLLHFSDTWQLLINTSTTIITFLMVFIIQNTQNRDNLAINLKLDALLKASKVDEQNYYGAEDESEKVLERRKKKHR